MVYKGKIKLYTINTISYLFYSCLYLCLAKQAKALDANMLARQMLDKILGLAIPQKFQVRVLNFTKTFVVLFACVTKVVNLKKFKPTSKLPSVSLYKLGKVFEKRTSGLHDFSCCT